MYKCIVVEPEIEGNIGFLARVMANFDFEQLILVNPQIRIKKAARDRAVHAQHILENVKITDTLEEALKKVDFSVATTGQSAESSSNVVRNCSDVRKVAERAGDVEGDMGVVLGRESKGLSNQELEKCDMVVKVPTSEEYPVMNITHAAGTVFYEFFRNRKKPTNKASSLKEREFIQHTFKNILDKIGYPEEETDRAMRCLKSFIGRSFLEKKEANTLIGVLKKIENRIGD